MTPDTIQVLAAFRRSHGDPSEWTAEVFEQWLQASDSVLAMQTRQQDDADRTDRLMSGLDAAADAGVAFRDGGADFLDVVVRGLCYHSARNPASYPPAGHTYPRRS
ncbi:hypothetical protein ACSCBZ_46515 [Streptomyces niveiscabiei]|uniref:hypothetical protein n=1 Tax=Streptomyces niveiscabiei TaxID=164115 RepID=UPI0006EBA45D|nr:hypothetical protein [Streptomyces niveiscabiei]